MPEKAQTLETLPLLRHLQTCFSCTALFSKDPGKIKAVHIKPTIASTTPGPEQKDTCQEYSYNPRKYKLYFRLEVLNILLPALGTVIL